MSRTRLAIRVLLCLLIVAMGWLVIRARTRYMPAEHVERAEQALAEGDWETARIHLQNALKENQANGAAHRLMGESLLAEAKSKGQPATYQDQANVEARRRLAKAASLLPEDAALQKLLLGIFLDRGSMRAAAEVAPRLAKKEPNNPEVLVALLYKAIESKNSELAEQRIKQLEEHPTDRVFRAASLAESHYGKESHGPQRAKVMADAVAHSASLSAEQLVSLPQVEQLLMVDLLKTAIQEAGDANVAHERAGVALDICDKIGGSGREVSQELAGFAADVAAVLRSHHVLPEQDAKLRQARAEITARVGKHLDQAVELKQASFKVYSEAARIAFDLNDHERVDQILSAALGAAADKTSAKTEGGEQEKLALELLAARNLFVMRRYSDVKPHLTALMASTEREYAGWGQLLSGGVASAEGRHETALEHYLQAQRLLGRTPFVKVALAKTYVALGRWRDAQPLLETAGNFVDSAEPTQQAWARLHEVFNQQVLWERFRAHLALDEWEPAQEVAKLMQGTAKEASVEALSAGYLAAHNRSEEALQRIAQAREKFPDDLALRIAQARLLVQAGQNEQARALIEELAQREDLSSQSFLAIWRMHEKRYDEAVKILDSLETRFPENPTSSYLKARVLLAAGKAREALAIAAKLRESPETAAAGNLVEILQDLREQNLTEASERMKAIAEDAPSVSPRMNLVSGRLSAAQGDFAAAVEQVSDSLDVTGLRYQARQTLLESLLQLAVKEGPQRAGEALAPLLEKYPSDGFLRIVEADLNFKQAKFDEGMSALNRVEQLLGRKPTPVYLKAAVWAQTGQTERALEEVKRCLAIDNEYPPAHVLAAQLYLAAGKHQLATAHAATALKRNPRQWDLYLVSAEALHQLGKSREAMQLLAAAIKLEPRFLGAYRGLESLQLATSRPEDALQTCRQARQAISESFVPVTDEISILCHQTQLDAAEALASESVKAPQEAGKCLAVSRTFALSGHPENALRWAQKGLEVATEEEKPAAYRQLGELALAEGQKTGDRQRLEAARDYFSKVVEVNPRDFIAGNNLAWLLATEFDQPQQAFEVVRKVQGEATVDQMPIGFLDTLAVVYRRAGKHDEARDLLTQALKSHPDNPVLMYHLGVILADRGQKSAALNMLERAIDSGNLSEVHQSDATKTLQALTGKAPAQPN